MHSTILAVLISFAVSVASAQETASAAADPARTTEPAKVKAESEAAATAKNDEEFELPPGFKARKRGDVTVYCIKGLSTGTRFEAESCYDKDQLHDYLLAREQNNADFNRSRAVCSNAAICAP
jgi:hypothetical protein